MNTTEATPPVSASLSASKTLVNQGEDSTLTWTSANATSCSASSGWSGELSTSGSQSTGALMSDTDFSLVCTGPGGNSPVSTVTVKVNPVATPTATLTADPTTVASGAASTLTWSSTNATACTASGGWSGALASSGTQSTGALTANTSYSLTCAGAGGTSPAATAAVTVTAAAPTPPTAVLPTATLTANPTTVASGAASSLTWSSTNATACTASGGWTGALAATGTQSTGALTASTTYSLTCTGAGGTSAAATATVSVTPPAPVTAPAPTVTLTANPTAVASGGTSTLTWSSTNATACTASGGWTGALAAGGMQATAALTATTLYTLTCTGAGGTSTPASATVTVTAGTMTVAPTHAELTISQVQQFTATVPGGGPATWTVDNIAGGNAAVGTVDATGLYTAGTAAGPHTVLATSAANTGQTASAAVAVTDLAGVYTYHNDLARDGANIQEYALNTTNVATATFGKRAACAVDGAVYAQPLWAANVTINGAKHNVVYAATQHDGLFAFDADASPCAQLWSVNLIDAAHGGAAGETTVPGNLVGTGAGDIGPEIGVTGTPVIDPSTNILYLVTKSINAAQTTFIQRVHAIDMTTGLEKPGSPVLVAASYPGSGQNDGSGMVQFDPKQELQRAGLALVNGAVYVAWSAHEDKDPWYGWLISYQYAGNALTQLAVLNVAPNTKHAGIWMSGGAPAADASNNLYVITGNGVFDAPANPPAPPAVNAADYGDSLLQLNTSLNILSYFTPSNQDQDNQSDTDFGAGGAALLADLPQGNNVVHALIAAGKDGAVYVLNRDLLGGSTGDLAAVQRIPGTGSVFATGALWNNNYYLASLRAPLYRFALNTANANFTRQNQTYAHSYGFAGATPSVSATGTQNGIVWALETGAYCTNQAASKQPNNPCGPVVVYAYDATNVSTLLWSSPTTGNDAAGFAIKFTVPTIANGKVYVGTRGNNKGGSDASTSTPGELEIYGLRP